MAMRRLKRKVPAHVQSSRKDDEIAFVERMLGDSIICQACGATLQTFADACTAGLLDRCAGFEAIEQAKSEFWRPKVEE